eukprot:CAMPEP_0116553672 /NCGR_PEP_ID=MMETSP0397-20121206/7175_1 /TAXON_ID=216820 /ORGANISM="Cyclophora tenuis, Strain ECT3854" /LENGTH=150 /DNA_ID=CAMNT_0004078765 /DNA_START=193 /DNA_END=642 /DNA_ORIENTATION=-
MTWSFRKALLDTIRPTPGKSRSIYVGFAPHFVMESLGRGVYVSAYEFFKKQIANNQGRVSCTTQERMLCAGLSGFLTCSLCFPLDSLRSRLIASSLSGQIVDPISMARTMAKEGGHKAFFRGFGVTALRAGPVAATVLPVYDKTLEWLNS